MLTDVAIIRLILILMMVFYHAFAPYSGGWQPIQGFPDIPVYWWLDKLSYFFMLEMFVFLSGYVFGYQVCKRGKDKLYFRNLFYSKFKRLMIPCMLFSAIYIFLFCDYTQMTSFELINGILSGTGHMWFLSMLFVCFIIIWLIEKTCVSPTLVFPILVLGAMLPVKMLPLYAGHSIYYMFWFYLGYYIQRKEIQLKTYYTYKTAVIFTFTFVILFPVVTLLNNGSVMFTGGGILELAFKFLRSGLSVFSKTIGVFILFCVINVYENNRKSEIPDFIIKVGSLCMGIYLLQQFILKILFDLTLLPEVLGPYLLPWVGFVIALLVSMVLTYYLRRNSIGRFILG